MPGDDIRAARQRTMGLDFVVVQRGPMQRTLGHFVFSQGER